MVKNKCTTRNLQNFIARGARKRRGNCVFWRNDTCGHKNAKNWGFRFKIALAGVVPQIGKSLESIGGPPVLYNIGGPPNDMCLDVVFARGLLLQNAFVTAETDKNIFK